MRQDSVVLLPFPGNVHQSDCIKGNNGNLIPLPTCIGKHPADLVAFLQLDGIILGGFYDPAVVGEGDIILAGLLDQ